MKPKPQRDQIADLKREIDALRAEIRGLDRNRFNYQPKPRVRTAITWTVSPASYPDNTHSTVPIVFTDGAVDQSGPSTTPPSFTNQSTNPLHYATTLDDTHVARATRVFVLEENGRWWIIGAAGGGTVDVCATIKAYPIVTPGPNMYVIGVDDNGDCARFEVDNC